MGSADWMNRNLSHRVEAAVPVEDPVLQARLKEILEIVLSDNRQAWDLHTDGSWIQRRPQPGEPERGTQQSHMDLTYLSPRHARPRRPAGENRHLTLWYRRPARQLEHFCAFAFR